MYLFSSSKSKIMQLLHLFLQEVNIDTKSVSSLPKAMGSKLKSQKLNLALSWNSHLTTP